MTMTTTGTYIPGDYFIVKSAGPGDSVVLYNDGPGTVYVTSQSLGKDYHLPAKAFVGWRFGQAGGQVSINVQNGSSTLTLQWLAASGAVAAPS